jgi:non-ribosomal peptide synthetase component F
MQHAHLPYQCIRKELGLPPATSLNISFDFQINCSDEHTINLIKLHNAQLEQVPQILTTNSPNGEVLSKFDLSLMINYDQHANTLACTLDGSCDLFNQITVQNLSHRFHTLCRQIFCSSSFDLQKQPVYELSIILPIERDMIQQLNNSGTPSNVTSCIHQAFVQQALMYPNKVAIILDEHSLTYGQLLNRVQQLALHLINDKGVKPGDVVCQCVDRSIEMIVGIMGIMMSGGVYAPLSPSDTLDRLESLIHQVDAKLVLVNQMSSTHVSLLSVTTVDISEVVNCNASLSDDQIDQLSGIIVTPESISHIVFTSGSTGIPKAVQLRHRNFISYMHAHFVQKNDITLQLASSSFDVHLDEIGGALVEGASLIMLKVGGHLDIDYVTKVIHQNNVTFITPVPSWMSALGRFLSENPHAENRVKQVHWWFIGGK